MNKKLGLGLAMCVLSTSILCSSCAKSNDVFSVNEDGTVSYVTEEYIEKSKADLMIDKLSKSEYLNSYQLSVDSIMADYEVVTKDGVEYYHKQKSATKSYEELEKELAADGIGADISKDHAYFSYYIDDSYTETISPDALTNPLSLMMIGNYLGISAVDLQSMIDGVSVDLSITFPNAITHSNAGKIEGNTASWSFGVKNLAYLSSNNISYYTETSENSIIENDATAPQITNLKNGNYYNKVKVNAKDDGSGLANVVVNGSPMGGKAFDVALAVEEGKNTITVYDFAGNSTSTSIVYDKTAPSVSGVKNGKTYKKAVAVKVKDKYGLKKITLNGKKFTSGKKVTKKGSYTLKAVDKAGNVKTVKFKLK